MSDTGNGEPRPPGGLEPARQALWEQLQSEYGITDAAGLAILQEAMRSLARADEARALLDKEGCTMVDRFGQRRAHPAAAIERDARAGFLAALRQLKIEVPAA
jgi:hypothetical protein